MKNNNYKISIVGAGYVGMSLACLLSSHYETIVFDIDEKRVNEINDQQSTIADKDIEEYLRMSLNLPKATMRFDDILDSDFVIICTPTNYDENTNQFNCSSVECTIDKLKDTDSTIIIKSTIPIGFTRKMREKYNTDRILFSPEFLREGHALEDNLYPSRIIVSSGYKDAEFADMLLKSSKWYCRNNKEPRVLIMGSDEAEAVKLFSNTYLAMRVAFFNELDSFAMKNDLCTKDIIDGVCLDKRIGGGYNNPSFGYGGYCLPKDTKQLLHNFEESRVINNDIIESIITSNNSRKISVADQIDRWLYGKINKTIGIYRLAMKRGSDNCRQNSSIDVAKHLKKLGYKVVIYEPMILDIDGFEVYRDLFEFKNTCDLIVANRINRDIEDVIHKVFTRDIFGEK